MNFAFVPVRIGSKGIPKKNINEVFGKPLLYWVISALEDCPKINKIFVASDSDEIDSVVNGLGFSKVFVYRRDPKNAKDHSTTESVMLEFLGKKKFSPKDRMLLAQVTSPLTKSADYANAIKKFEKEGCDSLLSCVKVKSFFWTNNKPINYDFKNRPRRKDFDGFFQENGAIYINTVENILKFKNRLSGKVSIYEMEAYQSYEIDEPEDLLIIEKIFEKVHKNL